MADGSSLTARVLTLPRVGIGMTTAALVALASGGTGLLVAHGTRQLEAVPGQVLPVVPTPPTQPVLVDRAPGSLVPVTSGPVRHVAARAALPVSRRVSRPEAPRAAAPAPPPAAPAPAPPPAPVATAPQPDTAPPPPPAPSGSRQKKAHPQDRGRHLGKAKKQDQQDEPKDKPQDQQQGKQDRHPSKG